MTMSLISVLPDVVRDRLWGSRWMRRRLVQSWARQNPYIGSKLEHEWEGSTGINVAVGKDYAQQHVQYLKACHEMGIGYRVVDIRRDDWADRLVSTGAQHLFIWPSVYNRLWKTQCEERASSAERDLGMIVHPDPALIWLYESKRRCVEWMRRHDVPHVPTWVFYLEDEAHDFITKATFPLVFKSDLGAAAHGVRILRNQAEAHRLVRLIFHRGLSFDRGEPLDRQWGQVLFQQFLPDLREWRMVRIGRSYFCREKQMGLDGMHSGSGTVVWAKPAPPLLSLFKRLSELGPFDCVNMDFFETTDGRFLVNEIHAVFGEIRATNLNPDDPWLGRFVEDNGGWLFESGMYYQNACANLRLQHVLSQSGLHVDVQPLVLRRQ
jgi:hypothetical protein